MAIKPNIDQFGDVFSPLSYKRYVDGTSGNDTVNKGTQNKPYYTITKSLVGAQFPLSVFISGQTITDTITLLSSQSNINLIGETSLKSRNNTILSGRITTSSGFTRLGLQGFQLNSGTSIPITLSSGDAGRHTFENIDFITSNSSIISIPTNFSNWLYFYNCDFGGSPASNLVLPNLTGTAIVRLYDCGFLNISVGSGWTVYTNGDTTLNITSKASTAVIVDLKYLRVNSVITDQTTLSTIIGLASGADGAYIVNFNSPTGITGISRGDVIWKTSAYQGILYKYIDAPSSISVFVTSTTQDTYIKDASLYWLHSTSSTVTIVNNLTTGGTTSALSAEQGKILNTNKQDKVFTYIKLESEIISSLGNDGDTAKSSDTLKEYKKISGAWVQQNVGGGGGGATNLDGLTDVDIITPSNSQVLLYINGKWENRAITDCVDLFSGDGKIPLSKVSINTINIRGTWNAITNMTTPKGGGAGSALTSGGATDGYVWIVQTAGNTTLDGYTGWVVNDWVYGNGTSWVKLPNGSSVTSVNGQTGAVTLIPNNLTLSTGTPISGTVNTGDGIETAILKIKNSLNGISSATKPTLTFLLNSSDIAVSGTGTSVNVSWTAQSNAVRYKVFLKQTSSGTINIITDSPSATITAPTNYTTLSVTQGVQYSYAVVAEITVDNAVNVANYTTQTSINNFIVDTFDLSAGTTSALSWSSVVGATEYRVQYQRATSLTSPTIITGITGTARTITGLTTSDPLDVNTDYSFKVEAYNSGGTKIAESSVVTRPVFDRIKLKLFSDSPVTIGLTSISRSGTVATVVTSVAHGLAQGDVISITGSVSPFNVTYALVSTIVSSTSFTYTVANADSTSTLSGTLQKFPNPFITWNYYKSLQYLNYLETTTVKAIPYTADIYKNFANYASTLIFSSTKYSYSGDAYAGWYMIKPYTSDGERYVLTDTNGNSALMMFNGTISYADRTDKFLFANDDHRSYKVWHGGGTYLANTNTNAVNAQNWFKLNPDLSQNNTASYISPLPNNLPANGQAIPATLLLSGYTVWFDNDNQRLTWIHKSGARQTSIAFSTLGISNLWGLTAAVGGGTLATASGWYVMHDNVNRIVIGNRQNASIGCWRITINFETGTAVATTMTRMSNTSFSTEEDSFGSEISTYFNLSNNTVQAIYHASYSAPNVTFALTPNIFTGNPDSYSTTTATIFGDMSQSGSNPVTMIAVDGNVYFVDWGHDDRGMYRPTGNDDGLGVVRVVNCSVHPRLLMII